MTKLRFSNEDSQTDQFTYTIFVIDLKYAMSLISDAMHEISELAYAIVLSTLFTANDKDM